MTFNPAVAKSLLMAASIGMVVPMMAQPPPRPPAKSRDEPAEVKIAGIEILRKDGRWLGLAIENGNFQLRFYDAEKKPEAPDVAHVSVRWNPVNKVGDERTVLNRGGDGKTLTSAKPVLPPIVFKTFLALISAEGETVETFVVNMTPAAQSGTAAEPPSGP